MKRDPKLLAAAIAWGVFVFVLQGCAHRESAESRRVLNCVYAAQYGPGLTPAQRNKAVEACK